MGKECLACVSTRCSLLHYLLGKLWLQKKLCTQFIRLSISTLCQCFFLICVVIL